MFNTVNWKQKAGFMALGSVFTIIGVLFTIGMLPSVTAERDKFGDIECTGLRVVDENGVARIKLSASSADSLYHIVNPMPGVFIGNYSPYGGIVIVNADNNNDSAVMLSHNEYGGEVTVYGKNRDSEVNLTTNEYGGSVGVIGTDGKSKAYMIIDEHGGFVAAQGKDGKSAATLQIDDRFMPRINIFTKGESKASMAIDVNGNGIVQILDKNGYLARFFDFSK